MSIYHPLKSSSVFLLSFRTFTVVKTMPWFGFTWCFLTISFRYEHWAKIILEGMLWFSVYYIRHMLSICPVTDDGNFGLFVKVMSARIPTHKVIFSALWWIGTLCGTPWAFVNILLHLTFPPLVFASIDNSYLKLLLPWFFWIN